MSAPAIEAVGRCPMCASASLGRQFEVTHLRDDPLFAWAQEHGYPSAPLLACRGCRFVFKGRRPSSDFLQSHYAQMGEEYLSGLAEDDPAFRTDHQWALQLLRREYPEGGCVLDAGCGRGFFLHALGEKWERRGVELSTHAAAYAGKEFGLRVHIGPLASAGFPESFFDIVAGFDVVEHLPEPMSFFVETRRILKPGGLLVVGTGDCHSWGARLAGSEWTYFGIPEHLSFFNQASMKAALLRAGYSAVRFRRIHHGEMNPQVARGWMRAVVRHWAIRCLGTRVTRWPLFRQKMGALPVPYFFDHFVCVAS